MSAFGWAKMADVVADPLVEAVPGADRPGVDRDHNPQDVLPPRERILFTSIRPRAKVSNTPYTKCHGRINPGDPPAADRARWSPSAVTRPSHHGGRPAEAAPADRGRLGRTTPSFGCPRFVLPGTSLTDRPSCAGGPRETPANQVLRTIPVKPAMNRAANAHANSWRIQCATVSQSPPPPARQNDRVGRGSAV
jgi:hypothetical protein